MDFEDLTKLIFSEMKSVLESNQGLYIFAKERAKFEGWLKVEICKILSKQFEDVIPEKDRIDIIFQNWVIELKTINTNYRYKNVKRKNRPITRNIQRLLDDIKKLKSINYTNKAVLFIVFPTNHNNQKWQKHLRKVSKLLRKIEYSDFKFRDRIPGVIYFGLV